MNKHRRVERICHTCGRTFQARVSDALKGFGRACSARCSGKLRGKGTSVNLAPFTEGSHPSEDLSEPKDV